MIQILGGSTDNGSSNINNVQALSTTPRLEKNLIPILQS